MATTGVQSERLLQKCKLEPSLWLNHLYLCLKEMSIKIQTG